MRRLSVSRSIIPSVALVVALGLPTTAAAQDKPRSGGELIFVVAAEPPSFDGHQEETFAMLHPGAPQYNTLMRVDPTDRTGTKFVGDLAESWTISPDRRTYTFKVRKGVKFHDGSVHDVEGRQGLLRPHHLPAGRRGVEPQGHLRGRWSRWRRRRPTRSCSG